MEVFVNGQKQHNIVHLHLMLMGVQGDVIIFIDSMWPNYKTVMFSAQLH